jgi:hypothetical protein
MPLKLTDITNKGSTNILNKWADDKELAIATNTNQLDIHTQQIILLQQQIAALQKAAK